MIPFLVNPLINPMTNLRLNNAKPIILRLTNHLQLIQNDIPTRCDWQSQITRFFTAHVITSYQIYIVTTQFVGIWLEAIVCTL